MRELPRIVSFMPSGMHITLEPAPFTRVRLQAVDQSRNIARGYEIEASPDLFGHWIVALHWGRLGTRGQSRSISFADPQAASRFVRVTLRRRASAEQRIGVAYSVVR
jgi:predicted DNA-binding WGR domain protein